MDTNRHHLPKLVVVAAAATSVALGAASAASATTEPPTDTASMGTEAAPPAGGSAATDVSAFCAAEVAVEAAFSTEDEAAIGPAVEDLMASAPEDIRPTVEQVLASAEAGPADPAFVEAYGALIEYLRANCGFAELNVAASEYAFGGIPEEVPAGPTIVTIENTGEEVHEIIFFRINDDVELSGEELLALPQEEAETMATFAGGAFGVFPGGTLNTVIDFAPGRYVAACFFPQGTTPEVFEQMMAAEAAAEGSLPPGSVPAGSAPAGTEHSAMTTEPASVDTAATDTGPDGGSAPIEGSVPPGEGPPHFTLGMFQEFTVV